MTIQSLADLTDDDARTVLNSLRDIILLSSEIAVTGNGNGHKIYQLARDARDAMLFDQISRDTIRRLSKGSGVVINGVVISDEVMEHAKAGRKINAIKQLREETMLGLKEAKDIVEAIDVPEKPW